ncbi:MAG: cytochrome, partial [Pseudomonadota bacterium]|nr:cytochrome [Pseudomonadota bacterium]
MMPAPSRLLAPALLGLMLMRAASAAEAAPRAEALHLRALAAGCAQCHGTDGRAVEG